MYLGDLIKSLEAQDPDTILVLGFEHPHSWRGNYSELAFEPARAVSVGSMLAAARSAMGATYQGWKGGDYTMSAWAEVHLADQGEMGEPLGATLLAFMLAATNPVTPDEMFANLLRIRDSLA